MNVSNGQCKIHLHLKTRPEREHGEVQNALFVGYDFYSSSLSTVQNGYALPFELCVVLSLTCHLQRDPKAINTGWPMPLYIRNMEHVEQTTTTEIQSRVTLYLGW
jgi:hypothetical protein